MQIDEMIKSGECYVLCICEGTAEEDIINFLLDHDCLIFRREDLLDKKPVRRISVSKIEERYLSYSHDKPVILLRVLDSKKEKFKLSKVYINRYAKSVINILTTPEIEILIIIKKGDYHNYSKKYKTTVKPSVFCGQVYKIKNIKNSGVMQNVFKTPEDLISTLRQYNKYKSHNELSIFDLLKT